MTSVVLRIQVSSICSQSLKKHKTMASKFYYILNKGNMIC